MIFCRFEEVAFRFAEALEQKFSKEKENDVFREVAIIILIQSPFSPFLPHMLFSHEWFFLSWFDFGSSMAHNM